MTLYRLRYYYGKVLHSASCFKSRHFPIKRLAAGWEMVLHVALGWSQSQQETRTQIFRIKLHTCSMIVCRFVWVRRSAIVVNYQDEILDHSFHLQYARSEATWKDKIICWSWTQLLGQSTALWYRKTASSLWRTGVFEVAELVISKFTSLVKLCHLVPTNPKNQRFLTRGSQTIRRHRKGTKTPDPLWSFMRGR